MTQFEQTRDALAVEMDGRCELTHPEHGRCSGNVVHGHHVVFRSHGGGHDRDNIAIVCEHHHREIHDGKLRGPILDEDGRQMWRSGTTAAGNEQRWYLWRDLVEQYEERAQQLVERWQIAIVGTEWNEVEAGEVLLQLDEQGLWELTGLDLDGDGEPVEQFARAYGRELKTVQSWIHRARIIRALPEPERDRARKFSRAVREVGATRLLELMQPDDRDAMYRRLEEGEPSDLVAASLRDEFPLEQHREPDAGRDDYEVTLTLREVTYTRTVRNAKGAEAAVESAKKRFRGLTGVVGVSSVTGYAAPVSRRETEGVPMHD